MRVFLIFFFLILAASESFAQGREAVPTDLSIQHSLMFEGHSRYSAIIPIRKIGVLRFDSQRRYELLDWKILERVHYRFGDANRVLVTVKGYVFELPREVKNSDQLHATIVPGGLQLTFNGETLCAKDFLFAQKSVTKEEVKFVGFGPQI